MPVLANSFTISMQTGTLPHQGWMVQSPEMVVAVFCSVEGQIENFENLGLL
jgi:hypothetical protein